jgi:hypothetical protein
MAGKNFQDMTLSEILEFETKHSCNLGRRVVSAAGFKRHRVQFATALSELTNIKKRRPAKAATV